MKAPVHLVQVAIVGLSLVTLLLDGCATEKPSMQQSSLPAKAVERESVEQQSVLSPVPESQQPEGGAKGGPQEQDGDVSTAYHILAEKREYGELRLSVATAADLYDLSTEQVKAIAETVVSRYRNEDKLVVFFYNSGRRPEHSTLAPDLALCRFDWSRAGGLKLRFDQSERRERKQEVLETGAIPKYEILQTFRQLNGRENGSILIPSFSKQTPHAERERVARLIMAAEGFNNLYMYATREALEADDSSAYARQHPEAKEGILGAVIDGRSIWK